MINLETKVRVCRVQDLGLIDYLDAYQVQLKCVEAALREDQQTILFCEHPAVLTMGRLAEDRHILYSKEILAQRGISVHRIDRGGEVTLHAPGQWVIYPILNLNYWKKDLHQYLSGLEEVAIDLLKDFGIVATRNFGKTGVWVGQDKIVSMGVGVKKWITYHGLAININTDLNLFSLIRPCGLDVHMTSMAKQLCREISIKEVKERLISKFAQHFDLKIIS